MDRAFQESQDDPIFGLWAALALELLARSAVAYKSPTLLAEPDKDQKYLLQIINGGVLTRSIPSARVFQLCSELYKEKFPEKGLAIANALINRRNEELHSGTAAFTEYPSSIWLLDFYKLSKGLCECQGKRLEDFFGKEEAANAEELLDGNRQQVVEKVKSTVAAFKKVFSLKSEEERKEAAEKAAARADKLAREDRHKTKCPACGSWGTVCGEVYGSEQISHEENNVVVRQPVTPRSFECSACGLKLDGYSELEVENLGGRYNRRKVYSPQEYYGVYDSEPFDSYNNE